MLHPSEINLGQVGPHNTMAALTRKCSFCWPWISVGEHDMHHLGIKAWNDGQRNSVFHPARISCVCHTLRGSWGWTFGNIYWPNIPVSNGQHLGSSGSNLGMTCFAGYASISCKNRPLLLLDEVTSILELRKIPGLVLWAVFHILPSLKPQTIFQKCWNVEDLW